MDFCQFNDGVIVCNKCKSSHLLSFYKPLSFVRCSKCGNPMFIPYRIADYWLFRPLGSGGMGSVYKAVHFNNGRKYAVKLLQRDSKSDSSVVEPLINEGKKAKLFNGHPNICSIADYGNNGKEVYLISEFIEGVRLDIIVENSGAVKEESVLLWSLQLLSALQHIYKKGCLYRDMKPQNVIIGGKRKKAVLIDFGLTVERNKQYTDGRDIIMGSPFFMPPERLALLDEDMSSEIFSLGMLMYYCLKGETYYTNEEVEEIIKIKSKKIKEKELSIELADNNPDIVHIIDNMIKRNPKERYQNFEDVYNELKVIYDVYRF